MSTGLTQQVIHLRWDGRSEDIPLTALDIGDMSTDAEIKTAIAVHYGVPVEKLRNYTVDRPAGQSMTLRPEATFGD